MNGHHQDEMSSPLRVVAYRGHGVRQQPIRGARILDTDPALDVLQVPVDHLTDDRADEVLDVLVPRPVEGADEHDAPVLVEEDPPELVQGADLPQGVVRLGIPLIAFNGLAERLLASRQDVDEERESSSGSDLRARPSI